LYPVSNRSHAFNQVNWTFGAKRTELNVRTKVHKSSEDLCFLEWTVPPEVTIGEVNGPGVRNWSRFGNRLQVWLQDMVTTAEVTFAGWMTNASETDFQLPVVHLASVPNVITGVGIEAQPDRQIVAEELSSLWPAPCSRVTPHLLEYLTDRPDYSGRFTIRAKGHQPVKPMR
jgi:hypothetical protein